MGFFDVAGYKDALVEALTVSNMPRKQKRLPELGLLQCLAAQKRLLQPG
jgi:hypothetical protein